MERVSRQLRDRSSFRIMQVFVFTVFVALASGSPTARKPGYGPGDQGYGYVTVRRGAYMFYWLFYTTANVTRPTDRPLVIWLQGGPGGSSTGYGNFAEVGPLHVNGSTRTYAWTKELNVLFIDNPVGTGYSYVENSTYLATNNVQIGKDMVIFLAEFYKRFPSLRATPTYIFSESYGGKMAVEIGKQLYDSKFDMKLRGVALIDPWISPIDSVMGWSPVLLSTGLIDRRSHKRLMTRANEVKAAIEGGLWMNATSLLRQLQWDIYRETSGIDFYNILTRIPGNLVEETSKQRTENQELSVEDNEIGKLMNGVVKSALKVPAEVVHGGQKNMVLPALWEDFMKPVTHVVTHLLDNTDLEVIIINGQLDLIVATYGTLNWVDNLNWRGKKAWASAKRVPFTLNGIIEGYVTKANGLSFYWVNRAGHMVPKDNAHTSMAILKAVTKLG